MRSKDQQSNLEKPASNKGSERAALSSKKLHSKKITSHPPLPSLSPPSSSSSFSRSLILCQLLHVSIVENEKSYAVVPSRGVLVHAAQKDGSLQLVVGKHVGSVENEGHRNVGAKESRRLAKIERRTPGVSARIQCHVDGGGLESGRGASGGENGKLRAGGKCERERASSVSSGAGTNGPRRADGIRGNGKKNETRVALNVGNKRNASSVDGSPERKKKN